MKPKTLMIMHTILDLFTLGLFTFLASRSLQSRSWVALVFEAGFGVLAAWSVIRRWPWTESKDDELPPEDKNKTDELKRTWREKF